MEIEYIITLIKTLDESSVTELEIEDKGTKIKLSKTAGTATVQAAPTPLPAFAAPENVAVPKAENIAQAQEEPAGSGLHEIKSPIVGTFYMAPSPDSPPFVEEGTKVRPGDTLCIVEAMKLMNEIECDVAGTVEKILIKNAQPVEYGQPIFLIKPE
jgi:acetyl-CoA carboxylase biotin carboxyl carrier protein